MTTPKPFIKVLLPAAIILFIIIVQVTTTNPVPVLQSAAVGRTASLHGQIRNFLRLNRRHMPQPRAEERRYSFDNEIEALKREQAEREAAAMREAEGPPPPPSYSFIEEAERELRGEANPDLGPASWEKPIQSDAALDSLRNEMIKAASENGTTEEKEDVFYDIASEAPNVPPYEVSEYQEREWTAPVYKDLGPEAVEGVLHEQAMLKRSKFIVPRKLMIEKTEELLKALFEGDKAELQDQLSDDFEFIGPVVGPLNKEEFIRAYTGFKVKEALPDLKENIFGWSVDPMEPNRVWWFTRSIGTHTGQFGGSIQPTGIRVEWPPEVNSVCFDSNGLVYRLTLGYAVDRKMGNTGGLGAVFGLLNAIGSPLPFREAKPWVPSARFLFFTKAMPGFRDFLKKGRDMRDRLLDKLEAYDDD
mmetsp:Transcript_12854/g.31528  ORF Transcript_12854/g.31528 Transcript_12854/m.31528 type:complete len:417 (-) Transcript_12854:296-1546(-)|eukprot:CAMPEP_0114518146 /NCGR_PEP_ID=MMETSP0109-20121206/18283_1 /TAXON_ID=29199 /ORGANISM="Chlorarachnion reptans, Strain CCCM449" /LENGTH=416 /DNA_ID=CAMNT_0001698737 /DNA_START=457 /DNA_END=1707 /DNA_ORIENTATION=-